MGAGQGRWLVYDDESRPSLITYPTGSDSFLWNALGQRMRATLNGTVKRYVYDGDRVLEQTDDAGNVTARYTTESSSFYQPGSPHGQTEVGLPGPRRATWSWIASGGLSRYPLYDAQGTVRRLADDSGAKTDYYTHSAFGYEYPPTGSTPNPYRFGGAWGYITDTPGSGLLQLGARFYWPEVGRFIQQDPIGEGINWYAYVGNNPLVWVDPDGLTAETNKQFLRRWLKGSLPSDIRYPEGSVELCEMKASPGANKMRDAFYKGGYKSIPRFKYGTWEAYNDTVLDSRYWASTAAQVGGFAGASAINNGNGTVTFTITNVAGTFSFFLHGVPNSPFGRGPMHNVTQHFIWTEPIVQVE